MRYIRRLEIVTFLIGAPKTMCQKGFEVLRVLKLAESELEVDLKLQEFFPGDRDVLRRIFLRADLGLSGMLITHPEIIWEGLEMGLIEGSQNVVDLFDWGC